MGSGAVGGALYLLVGQDLDVGQADGVVDADVTHSQPALARRTPSASVG